MCILNLTLWIDCGPISHWRSHSTAAILAPYVVLIICGSCQPTDQSPLWFLCLTHLSQVTVTQFIHYQQSHLKIQPQSHGLQIPVRLDSKLRSQHEPVYSSDQISVVGVYFSSSAEGLMHIHTGLWLINAKPYVLDRLRTVRRKQQHTHLSGSVTLSQYLVWRTVRADTAFSVLALSSYWGWRQLYFTLCVSRPYMWLCCV